jgi:cell wall-associated NlpC family hydrolase
MRPAIIAAATPLAIPVALVLVVVLLLTPDVSSVTSGPSALAGIPTRYLALYEAAAQTCPGLPWTILAGIGKVESDHGQSIAPGVSSGANYAGAESPMQFEPATFAEYATGPDKPLSPYDPADAIYSAAAMLCASGARGGTESGISKAIYAYNHASWYVAEVESWAATYATEAAEDGAPDTATTAGDPAVVREAIAYAEAQVGKPYVWGGTGPAGFDCSGLVYEAYLHAGIAIGRTTYQWRQDGPVVQLAQIQPGDLLFYAGSDGTATDPGHVVMYLGDGQIIQAPQTGEEVQIDPLDESGVIVATRPSAIPITGCRFSL